MAAHQAQPPQARLDFGIGVIAAAGEPPTPVTFSVTVKTGDTAHEVFTHAVHAGDFADPIAAQWVDASVDVSRWAGQDATFTFFAANADGNVYPGGRWAAPILYAAVDRPADFRAAAGYGVGARWRSPVGTLSFDVAYGELTDEVRVHFTVGLIWQ